MCFPIDPVPNLEEYIPASTDAQTSYEEITSAPGGTEFADTEIIENSIEESRLFKIWAANSSIAQGGPLIEEHTSPSAEVWQAIPAELDDSQVPAEEEAKEVNA